MQVNEICVLDTLGCASTTIFQLFEAHATDDGSNENKQIKTRTIALLEMAGH